jgi:predicted NodU family carbamoyl transferase
MNKKQISLLAAFAAANVEYAIVGGVAVNAHGYVRATNDLDIFIRPTEENARAAFGALVSLGVPLEGMEPNDLLDEEENLRFGPEEDHVDILASIGEMPFEQVWRNRIETEVEGVPVPLISKGDLIQNKRQVGRLRDLADAEELALIPDEAGQN